MKDCIRDEETSLKEHMVRSGGWMLKVVAKEAEVCGTKVEYVKRVDRRIEEKLTGK